MGGKARAASMTQKQRTESSRKAANAMWDKKRSKLHGHKRKVAKRAL